MMTEKKETYDVIPLIQEFNHLSPVDIEDLLEWLADREYLSENGKKFRSAFWKMFIKEKMT